MSKKEKVLLRASAIDGDMTEYHFSIEFYIFREGGIVYRLLPVAGHFHMRRNL